MLRIPTGGLHFLQGVYFPFLSSRKTLNGPKLYFHLGKVHEESIYINLI